MANGDLRDTQGDYRHFFSVCDGQNIGIQQALANPLGDFGDLQAKEQKLLKQKLKKQTMKSLHMQLFDSKPRSLPSDQEEQLRQRENDPSVTQMNVNKMCAQSNLMSMLSVDNCTDSIQGPDLPSQTSPLQESSFDESNVQGGQVMSQSALNYTSRMRGTDSRDPRGIKYHQTIGNSNTTQNQYSKVMSIDLAHSSVGLKNRSLQERLQNERSHSIQRPGADGAASANASSKHQNSITNINHTIVSKYRVRQVPVSNTPKRLQNISSSQKKSKNSGVYGKQPPRTQSPSNVDDSVGNYTP